LNLWPPTGIHLELPLTSSMWRGEQIEPTAASSQWSAHDARDGELLRRIGAGERAAFEALYRCYFVRLVPLPAARPAALAGNRGGDQRHDVCGLAPRAALFGKVEGLDMDLRYCLPRR
jgi:hypothetical protein